MAQQSYLHSEATFKKGQADGINGTINILTSIINGSDKGVNAVSNRELEKIRRVFLIWRDNIIEKMSAGDKTALNVLIETKKIMDIKIPMI
jgi:hypothetical protein